MHITTTHLPASDVGRTTSTILTTAATLVQFAKRDSEFTGFLYQQTQHLPDTTKWALREITPSPFLVPADRETAVARTHWLLSEVAHLPEEEAEAVSATLVAWRKEVAPKDQIIGIVGIAIIGPTLGIIKRRKKKRSAMPIVIDEALRSLPAGRLIAIVHDASTIHTSTALRQVDGNARQLSPDLFEWYFEERALSLHVAPADELQTLDSLLTAEQLPHTAIYDAGVLQAIAISPEVNSDILDTITAEKL